MFYNVFVKKTSSDLRKILNSASYQEAARETARRILMDRNENYQLDDETAALSKLSTYQLLEKLKDYGIKVKMCSRERTIELIQNNHGFTIGIAFFFIGILFLLFMLFFISQEETVGGKVYFMRSMPYIIPIFISAGVLNYKRDRVTKVKINIAESNFEIYRGRIWKNEYDKIAGANLALEYKQVKPNKYLLYVQNNPNVIDLFVLNDNKIENQTLNYITVLIEKVKGEMVMTDNNLA